MNKYNDVLVLLKEIALKAGEIMLDNYEKEYKIYTKEDGTKVTDVDLAISDLAKHIIEKERPEIRFFSEENVDKSFSKTDDIIIMDELDATSNFIKKRGAFSHCSAFYDKSEGLVIGLIYYPLEDKMFSAIKNQGAYLTTKGVATRLKPLNGKQEINDLKYGHPFNYKGDRYLKLFNKMQIEEDNIIRSTGSDILDIISGNYDIAISLHSFIPAWDLAPSIVIFEEMDYLCKYLDGGKVDIFEKRIGNKGYAFAHANIMTKVLDLISDKT